MTGIYSSLPPTHELPREPINAMRARDGLRPLCYDRPDHPETQTVNDGWTWDGMLQSESVRNDMSKDCKAWSVHPGFEYVWSEPSPVQGVGP